ncbi:MAG TPA: IS701 family transposase [Gemmatimonadales bacterium]|jgi:SRSO17 transposase|nr:IS701 family transposase [Gemmatimonadales bacterium]
MHWRYRLRKQQLLAECEVPPEVFRGGLERLAAFAVPFAACLVRQEQRDHARTYLAGLVSDLKHKTAESIAYRHDQERHGLQHFVGSSTWDHRPLLRELAGQVAREIGTADGVIVFDPSGFPKKGTASVGVQRQWLGRLGKVDNGQVGVFMAYASYYEHALVDVRLYLPRAWATDRARRKRCGIPKVVRYRTRHELALEMLAETGPLLPHAWVTGDDEMGRSSRFRAELRTRGERYLLAVPSNTTIRDLEGEPPEWGGRGPHPKRAFERVRAWAEARPPRAWRRIEVGDGERGPQVVELVATRVVARTDRGRIGPEELLVVIRSADADGATRHDYYLSSAPPETLPGVLAQVAKAEHRVERCLQRGKSEAGLAESQVRTWSGWHHHQALSLIAAWFLVQEARRGKKGDAGADGAAGACRAGVAASGRMRM